MNNQHVEKSSVSNIKPTHVERVTLILCAAAFSAQLVIASRLTEASALLVVVRQMAIAIVVITSLVGAGLCFNLQKTFLSLISISFLVSIPVWIFMFDNRTGQPFEIFSGGNNFALANIGLLAVLIRSPRSIDKLFRYIYILSACYAAIYVVTTAIVANGLFQFPPQSSIYLGADASSGRSARLIMSYSFICFGLFTSICSLLRRYNGFDLLVFALCVVAVLANQGRTLQATVGLVSVSYLLTRRVRLVVSGAFIVFLFFLIASMVIPFTFYNPFDENLTDVSAWARYQDIVIVQQLLPRFWLTGAGLASGPNAYLLLTGFKYFYTDDIGLIGVFFNYGIVGLLIYLFEALGVVASLTTLRSLGVEDDYARAAALAGANSILGAAISPNFASSDGVLWAAFYLIMLASLPSIGMLRWKPIQSRH